MNENAIKEITKLLNLKYWFGGNLIFPWKHPLNKVQNAAVITLDGCIQYKFKVHKNDKLRCMEVRKHRTLSLGLKPLQTITLDELKHRIALNSNKQSSSYIQMTNSKIPSNLQGWNNLMTACGEAINSTSWRVGDKPL